MKLLLLLCFVFAVSGINAYVPNAMNIMKLIEIMNKYITECKAERAFELNEDDLTRKLSNKQDIEKEGKKEITHCFLHKADILKPDGTLNIKTAKKILTFIGLEENEANKILKQCGSITGADDDETAYLIFNCVDKTAKS
ncbi:hypothetical protein PYW08_004957 [Mythimna loreyi]|uniref:Uncharacterized protein n=1 Tax=Mythimna loreyi TaxID=667449 RepID=A0ACC2QE42_9NEOP|nr:hypothetical protein PYW08_004957 [Mythimna loreyi]